MSTVVAGPFAATLLADLGADVIKVELPGKGDPLRELAPHKNGVPLWWKVTNRNKKGISLDLRKPDGMALLARLLADRDVLIENFRSGTLDQWGITREWLQAINPRLTILRVTGFGQTGPYRDRPGFARIFEAMSGFTRMCGEEGGSPLHLGYPISDAIGGLFGAVGVLSALYRLKEEPAARGQEIDCSMTEAMLRTLDFLAIEYDQLGVVRTASGNRSQYAAPGNIYATGDGKWASIAASTQSIFVRLCAALELEGLLERSEICRQSVARKESRYAGCDRRRRNCKTDSGGTPRQIRGPRGRLLADLRCRRYFRRSAFHRARNHRQRVRSGTRRCPHAMRGAALLGNAGRGAQRRSFDRPAQ